MKKSMEVLGWTASAAAAAGAGALLFMGVSDGREAKPHKIIVSEHDYFKFCKPVRISNPTPDCTPNYDTKQPDEPLTYTKITDFDKSLAQDAGLELAGGVVLAAGTAYAAVVISRGHRARKAADAEIMG